MCRFEKKEKGIVSFLMRGKKPLFVYDPVSVFENREVSRFSTLFLGAGSCVSVHGNPRFDFCCMRSRYCNTTVAQTFLSVTLATPESQAGMPVSPLVNVFVGVMLEAILCVTQGFCLETEPDPWS